jgi:predicted nuclease of predicted toxin-antitoxin system
VARLPWVPLEDSPDDEGDQILREISGKCHFLVDESLGVEVARFIREVGWKAVYVSQVGLAGHSDEDVFAYAFKRDYVLLTHDRDFLDDRRFPPHRNPGVIILPGAEGNESELTEALAQVLTFVGRLRGVVSEAKVVVNKDQSWSIKTRNLDTGAMETHRYKFFEPHGVALVWKDR